MWRPFSLLKKYPDRDQLHRYKKNATASIVPGNVYFNNAVKFGKKAYILGRCMMKGIRRKELNSKLHKFSTQFRPFIGVTLKQMETYVKPTLNDDTPDILILHIGCNDFGNKQLTENEIAEWIVRIGRQCKESNGNDVFNSSLICRAQKRLNDNMIAVNNILKRVCKLHGFGFIDNTKQNICIEDGLHANDNGKVILANNFICVLNRFFLWNEKIYNGTTKNDFLLKANFYNDNDESSNFSNSFKIKESYPSICGDVVGNSNLRALRKKEA